MGKQEIKTAAKMPGRVAYFDVLNILATISVGQSQILCKLHMGCK